MKKLIRLYQGELSWIKKRLEVYGFPDIEMETQIKIYKE